MGKQYFPVLVRKGISSDREINMKRIDAIATALEQLKDALAIENITLKRILVDKTLDLKYELSTGRSAKDYPKTPCDPFNSLVIGGITVVGQDNEFIRNHREWPDD